MSEIAQIPKTALDVFRMLPEGTLCEVIDNVLYMSPAPKYDHQKIVGLFFRHISSHLDQTRQGIIAISPVDVYFENLLSAVQPDLIFVSNENMNILQDGYFYGAPDIVFEMLSTDKKRDLIEKKNLYERAGVKEYFIIDPKNKNVIAYSLVNGSYQLLYKDEGHFHSLLLGFEFTF